MSGHTLFDLSGKCGYVTGGGSGLGRAIANGLAESGAAVVVSDINSEAAETVAMEIRTRGGNALALRTNVAHQDEVDILVRTTIAQLGRLDFAFNDETSQPPAPQAVVLHPPARAYFVYPCPYASCNGEFDLAASVAEIADSKKTSAAGHIRCTGERTRGRQGKSSCDLHIEYSIAVGK